MAGYSATPLLAKLGIKPGYRIFFRNPPASYFDLLSPFPEDTLVSKSLTGQFDLIQIFSKSFAGFQKALRNSIDHLKPNGMIWVSWPKKTSGVSSDLDENKIRAFGLSLGLVDIKVCAVDATWSGLKFVVPVSQRKAPNPVSSPGLRNGSI
jgi:hypothetical protein